MFVLFHLVSSQCAPTDQKIPIDFDIQAKKNYTA